MQRAEDHQRRAGGPFNAPLFTACQAAEKRFGTSFETLTAHRDFVARVNFAGDLNCKVEIEGKFILAYGTPLPEPAVRERIKR